MVLWTVIRFFRRKNLLQDTRNILRSIFFTTSLYLQIPNNEWAADIPKNGIAINFVNRIMVLFSLGRDDGCVWLHVTINKKPGEKEVKSLSSVSHSIYTMAKSVSSWLADQKSLEKKYSSVMWIANFNLNNDC